MATSKKRVISPARLRDMRKKPGGSNVSKARAKLPRSIFAGPSGGAPALSFPVRNKSEGKSAINLSHNAPRPSGIRAFVFRKFPSLLAGSKFNKSGQVKKRTK